MSYTFRATFPALFLSLVLPCALPVLAADPAPAKDAAAEAPVERAPLLSRSQEDAIALERQLPREDQQQLQAGDESFLALWKPANSDEPQGAVIIVPGDAESPDWPDAVGPLRRKFPDVGWSSLSITLPDAIDNSLVPREPDAASTDANAAKPKESPRTPVRKRKTRQLKPGSGCRSNRKGSCRRGTQQGSGRAHLSADRKRDQLCAAEQGSQHRIDRP